jgi:hypothetical protein
MYCLFYTMDTSKTVAEVIMKVHTADSNFTKLSRRALVVAMMSFAATAFAATGSYTDFSLVSKAEAGQVKKKTALKQIDLTAFNKTAADAAARAAKADAKAAKADAEIAQAKKDGAVADAEIAQAKKDGAMADAQNATLERQNSCKETLIAFRNDNLAKGLPDFKVKPVRGEDPCTFLAPNGLTIASPTNG